MESAARDRLLQLLTAHGPSGREREAADLWAAMAGEFVDDGDDSEIRQFLQQAPAEEPVVQQRVLDEHDRVGRNDPCWCGSGKKFKKCHGAA